DLFSGALIETAWHNSGARLQLFHRHGKIKSSPMRLFTAIDLPQEIVDRLDELISDLRPRARINWSTASNLHITTKFIGHWPEDRLPQLNRALDGLGCRPPIAIRVAGLGFFPNERSPRVFWAGVEASSELVRL